MYAQIYLGLLLVAYLSICPTSALVPVKLDLHERSNHGPCTTTPVMPMGDHVRCGDEGFVKHFKGHILKSQVLGFQSDCVDACIPHEQCISFSYAANGTCITYNKDIDRQNFVKAETGVDFWNRHCYEVNCPKGCPTGETKCKMSGCTFLSTDPWNCGTCNNACPPAAQQCYGGSCVCPTQGQTLCGSTCTDTNSDLNNCGACGTSCPTGNTCSGGSCTCPSGESFCGGNTCLSLNSDQNCGQCSIACAGDTHCNISQQCGCPSGTTLCPGNTCPDTQTDSQNCGSCGNACTDGQTCSSGACSCPGPNQSLCDGSCNDFQFDNQNCGSCGNACTGGQTCSSGMCTCPGTTTLCGATCIPQGGLSFSLSGSGIVLNGDQTQGIPAGSAYMNGAQQDDGDGDIVNFSPPDSTTQPGIFELDSQCHLFALDGTYTPQAPEIAYLDLNDPSNDVDGQFENHYIRFGPPTPVGADTDNTLITCGLDSLGSGSPSTSYSLSCTGSDGGSVFFACPIAWRLGTQDMADQCGAKYGADEVSPGLTVTASTT